MSLDENNSMLGRRRATTTKSVNYSEDGCDDEGYVLDPETGRRIDGDKNGDIAAVFKGDDDDEEDDGAYNEKAENFKKEAAADAEDDGKIGAFDGDDFSVVVAAAGGKGESKNGGGKVSKKRKGEPKNDGGGKASKKRKGESKNDGGGKVSKKRPNGELKDDNDYELGGSAPKKQRKENKNPNNKAASTALVKTGGAKSTINEEGPCDTKQAILDKVDLCKCSFPGCVKNYVYGKVYTGEKASGIGYCTPHLTKVIAALTSEELILHEKLKVQHLLEVHREYGKNANLINGATMDEHIWNFAKDPELPSISVNDAGLLTVLEGNFSNVYQLLKAAGFNYKDEQTLMNVLRKDYAAIPDKQICKKNCGPDDEGRTTLVNGWWDGDVLLWFHQYDLDEHGGKPKFGMDEEYLKRLGEKRKKATEKKAAEKKAAGKKGRKRAAKAILQANPAASAALAAVLESAQDNQSGAPDAKVLAKALALGYSKIFIDAKIAEQEELNVKPAAK